MMYASLMDVEILMELKWDRIVSVPHSVFILDIICLRLKVE